MKKLKTQKGITLIALIITIIVLLILAMVAISAVTGDGILGYAKKAKSDYSSAQANEQGTLQGYLDKIQSYFSGGNGGNSGGNGGNPVPTKTMEEAKNNENLTKDGNVVVVDKYGNTITVPKGFKIVVDDTTNNADDVTKGIVIEECTGTGTQGTTG